MYFSLFSLFSLSSTPSMLQTGKESKNSSFIKLYYKCGNLLRFCIFPSLRDTSQSAFFLLKSFLFSPLPAECHLKTFQPLFHPCKHLTLKLHHRFLQQCKNTHMHHANRSSLCSFFLALWPKLTKRNLFTKASKSAYIT